MALWIRQIFSGPARDPNSILPAPPRAVHGHKALPVYGHTFLFQRLAGDVALLFPTHWKERRWGGRTLGEMFAMYVWGQWRVVIKGPEKCQQVIEAGGLKASFPWTPPTTLLGMSCLSFLQEDDAEQMRILLSRPLCHKTVIQYARAFAEAAEKCLDGVVQGKFTRQSKRDKVYRVVRNKRQTNSESTSINNTSIDDRSQIPGYVTDNEFDNESEESTQNVIKVKWEALRSYSFDLIDGPILSINKWSSKPEQAEGESTKEEVNVDDTPSSNSKGNKLPSRDTMLLWMDRLKVGVDVIKITFGPEWMYIWLMNEYGRALNARMHISSLFARHAKEMGETVPVERREGHTYNDPTTQPIPLLTLRDNYMREKEDIFGVQATSHGHRPRANLHSGEVRARANTAPEFKNLIDNDSDDDLGAGMTEYVAPYATEQDLARPRYEQSPAFKSRKSTTATTSVSPSRRILFQDAPPVSPSKDSFRDNSQLDAFVTPPTLGNGLARPPPPPSTDNSTHNDQKQQTSILEHILRRQDMDGNGISEAVMTELMISLWMMLDAGNAWTAMALNLLSLDKDACIIIQDELDRLVTQHGRDGIFSPTVLDQTNYLDALIYEAIRLCPPFLGGLKETSETIEFPDLQIQLGKGSFIFFCQPTNECFDIRKSLGKRPEELGKRYPCVEL